MPRVQSLSLDGEALEKQEPGQCLLAFAGRPHGEEEGLWALSISSNQANTLWLDNLYLRCAFNSSLLTACCDCACESGFRAVGSKTVFSSILDVEL